MSLSQRSSGRGKYAAVWHRANPLQVFTYLQRESMASRGAGLRLCYYPRHLGVAMIW